MGCCVVGSPFRIGGGRSSPPARGTRESGRRSWCALERLGRDAVGGELFGGRRAAGDHGSAIGAVGRRARGDRGHAVGTVVLLGWPSRRPSAASGPLRGCSWPVPSYLPCSVRLSHFLHQRSGAAERAEKKCPRFGVSPSRSCRSHRLARGSMHPRTPRPHALERLQGTSSLSSSPWSSPLTETPPARCRQYGSAGNCLRLANQLR